MSKGKSLAAAKVQEMMDQMDDIISSGYGWAKWHEKQLSELFEPLSIAARKQVFKSYYGGELPEGTTGEELEFMAKLCGIKKLAINISELEDEFDL